MDQPNLTMTILGRMGLGPQGASDVWKIERYYRPGQPTGGVRAEPFVWLIHVLSPSSGRRESRVREGYSGRPPTCAGTPMK